MQLKVSNEKAGKMRAALPFVVNVQQEMLDMLDDRVTMLTEIERLKGVVLETSLKTLQAAEVHIDELQTEVLKLRAWAREQLVVPTSVCPECDETHGSHTDDCSIGQEE